MSRDRSAPPGATPASPPQESASAAHGAAARSAPARSTGAWPDGQRGTWLVGGLLLLGVTAAVAAIWFQRQQTRKCLAFYGPVAARRITAAAGVELLAVQPGSVPRRLAVASRLDVSQAPGLVHLRRGLVEDANFNWPEVGMREGGMQDDPQDAAVSPAPRPLDRWDAALVFTDRNGGGQTTLVVDLDESGGALAVVGQPGWIGLGRIGRGLAAWIRDTWSRNARIADAPPRGTPNLRHRAE